MVRKSALPAWCKIVRDRKIASEYGIDVRHPMRSPREVAVVMAPRFESEEVEIFVTVLLDAQHKMIAAQEVTRGLVNSSLVAPREVFRLAIAMNASALILAHNHPSGDPTPSAEDRAVTEQLVAAGRLLDLPVHDHLVFGHNRYVSFAESGLL